MPNASPISARFGEDSVSISRSLLSAPSYYVNDALDTGTIKIVYPPVYIRWIGSFYSVSDTY